MPTIAEINQLLGRFNEGYLIEVEKQTRIWTEQFPTLVPAWKLLGICLHRQGKLTEALPILLHATELAKNDAEAHYNLGVTQDGLGQLNEAVASYRNTLNINKNYAAAHNNLGNILLGLGQLEEAVEHCHRALRLKPNYAGALNNLGNALSELGKVDAAGTCFRKALQINPQFAEAHSNLLFCLNHIATEPQELFREHNFFAEKFELPLQANWPRHTNLREPGRALKIGFVSADLRNHPVAHFLEPVLACLAKQAQLSLHIYYNYPIEDGVSNRLKGYVKEWKSIVALSESELAQQIQADGIDILYDLSGHTGKNRLLAFALKPAPIQVSWIGYPNTTGLFAMDYYQSDCFLFPDNRFDNQFTEKIVRLPAASVFLPYKDAPPVNALPIINNGHMTLGSFNRLSKISRSVVALWAQLMHNLPDSKLLLGAMPQDGEHQSLLEWFAQEGIAQDRLIFHVRSGIKNYLELHHQIDICLDTFPYGGGTTTFHALWMGVPTLTLAGNTMAGYAGASILGHVGLEAFAAHDANDFVQKGIYWANHLTELSVIRAELRERFAKSARGRPDVVAAAMERALRIMWQRWCAGLPAETFEVTLQEAEDILRKSNQ